jgi:hypothetical protein
VEGEGSCAGRRSRDEPRRRPSRLGERAGGDGLSGRRDVTVLERSHWLLPQQFIWSVDFNNTCFILISGSLGIRPQHKSIFFDFVIAIHSPGVLPPLRLPEAGGCHDPKLINMVNY